MKRQVIYSNIYILSYLILLITDILKGTNINSSVTNDAFKLGLVIFFALNIFLFFINKYDYNYYFKCLIIIIIVIVLGYLFKFKTIPIELIALITLLANIHFININKLIKLDLAIKIGIFLMILLLMKLGIIQNVYSKGFGLGFLDPDIAGTIILSIVFSLFLLYLNKKGSNKHINIIPTFILSMFIILISYYVTKFRSLIIIGCIIFIFVLFADINIIRFISYKLFPYLGIIIPFISIFIVYKLNLTRPLWNNINKLLSNRLIMQYVIVQDDPLKWCGQHIMSYLTFHGDLVSLGYNSIGSITIDNFYLATAYYDGIVGLLIFAFIIIRIMHIAGKYNEYIPAVILFSIIVCSCVSSGMFNSYDFPIMLYIIAYADFVNEKCKHIR